MACFNDAVPHRNMQYLSGINFLLLRVHVAVRPNKTRYSRAPNGPTLARSIYIG